VLFRTIAPHITDPLIGDLMEEAALRARRGDPAPRTRWWLASQAIRSLPWLASLRLRRATFASASRHAKHAELTQRTQDAERPRRTQRNAGTSRRLVLAGSLLGAGTVGGAVVAVAAFGLAPLPRLTHPSASRAVPPPAAGGAVQVPPPVPPPVLPAPPLVPPLALVLVLDRSGSMSATDTGGPRTTRLSLAIEGARRALRTLSLGDAVGVVSFDYDSRWVADLKQLSRAADFDDVERKLSSIVPDGGTDIYRALEMTYRGLQQTPARTKHVILLTDGEQGSPAPFPTLVDAMRRAYITVSTIGIASQGSAATTLEHIARLGQGRHTVVTTPADLPDVLAHEAHTFVTQVRSPTSHPM